MSDLLFRRVKLINKAMCMCSAVVLLLKVVDEKLPAVPLVVSGEHTLEERYSSIGFNGMLQLTFG